MTGGDAMLSVVWPSSIAALSQQAHVICSHAAPWCRCILLLKHIEEKYIQSYQPCTYSCTSPIWQICQYPSTFEHEEQLIMHHTYLIVWGRIALAGGYLVIGMLNKRPFLFSFYLTNWHLNMLGYRQTFTGLWINVVYLSQNLIHLEIYFDIPIWVY